jgi:hypothetical protein
MRPFIIKSVLFFSLFWVGSYILAKTLDRQFAQDRSNKQLWVLSQHNRSVDYAVAGSSRAQNNIDTATLEGKTGRPAVNIAYEGNSIMDMYLTLHLFLNHGNQVGNLLLQLDGTDLDYSHEFLTYMYLPYLTDPEVRSTVREMRGFKGYAPMRIFPLAKYWEYNNFYDWELLRQARSGATVYDKSGGSELLYDDRYHEFPAITNEPEFKVNSRSRRYLDRIVQLTKSHGIGLTIFSAPMYHRDQTFKKYDEASRKYLATYCEEQRIPYLDFTNANFDRSEFRDYGHLNGAGALRFTEMLGASFVGQGNGSDIRTPGDTAGKASSGHP